MENPTDPAQALTGSEVNRIALQAISQLAPDLQEAQARPKVLDVYVNRLLAAALTTGHKGMMDVLRDMRRAHISDVQITEHYIPAAARNLGDDWVADRLDFGAVTIGAARLQGLLRRMAAEWDDGIGSRPGYLVGVPEGVQHTLGVSVLAGQLRARGARVFLDYELTPQSIATTMRNTPFAGVMLSAAGRKWLDPLSDLVDAAKAISRSTPVILGGSILEHAKDIQFHTGADLVTRELGGAMALCEQSLNDRIADGTIGALGLSI